MRQDDISNPDDREPDVHQLADEDPSTIHLIQHLVLDLIDVMRDGKNKRGVAYTALYPSLYNALCDNIDKLTDEVTDEIENRD